MVWGELFIAFIIAFVLSLLFGAAFRWERPGRPGLWPSIFFLFVIIFLVTWAIGGWVTPVGPAVSGIYWLSFLIVGVIVALILAAAIPPRRACSRRRTRAPRACRCRGSRRRHARAADPRRCDPRPARPCFRRGSSAGTFRALHPGGAATADGGAARVP